MSPSLGVIFVLQWDPWIFQKLQKGPTSSSTSLPLCFICRWSRAVPPPTWRAAGHLLLLHRHTRHPCDLLAPLPFALDLSSPCHAAQSSSAAATSMPPWRARDRARLPHLSRASAPGESPQPIPLTTSPVPRPQTPERRRHPSATLVSQTPP